MAVITKTNPLLGTDVYKMGHADRQYVQGCNKVYSYLIARTDKNFDRTIFFGLQYYLKEYLSIKLTPEMGEEFLKYRKLILGENSEHIETEIRKLCELGYFPVEIKAVPEGTVMPVRNVLMTITNTLDGFHWVVGFIESLILKVWYPITVSSCVYKYKTTVDKYFEETVDEDLYFLKSFTVHDFGYRGDTSEEGSALSGAGHLLSFTGSDTVPALKFIKEYYNADVEDTSYMLSVPASEHSVACSFGKDNEFEYFTNMLDLYPSGIVSLISDTYNVFHFISNFAERLKSRILERDGKVVFRPDSGNPKDIICGTIEYIETENQALLDFESRNDLKLEDKIIYYITDSKKYIRFVKYSENSYYVEQQYTPTDAEKGCIVLLDEIFGSSINSKGFKVLNPKVGLIYGDGMYLERYIATLEKLKSMGYASQNLVIGVGGILRNHSRDTLGFAIKATHVEVNGIPRDIEKDPITDSKKKSHKGLMYLTKVGNEYQTIDECTVEEEKTGLLQTVFKDGKLVKDFEFSEIKNNVQKGL